MDKTCKYCQNDLTIKDNKKAAKKLFIIYNVALILSIIIDSLLSQKLKLYYGDLYIEMIIIYFTYKVYNRPSKYICTNKKCYGDNKD